MVVEVELLDELDGVVAGVGSLVGTRLLTLLVGAGTMTGGVVATWVAAVSGLTFGGVVFGAAVVLGVTLAVVLCADFLVLTELILRGCLVFLGEGAEFIAACAYAETSTITTAIVGSTTLRLCRFRNVLKYVRAIRCFVFRTFCFWSYSLSIPSDRPKRMA